MGLKKGVRNEILSSLTARPPLQLFVMKQVYRFHKRLLEDDRGRIAASIAKWVHQLSNETVQRKFGILGGIELVELYQSPSAMYKDYLEYVE